MGKPFQTDIPDDRWRDQKPHSNPLLKPSVREMTGITTPMAPKFPGTSTGQDYGQGDPKGNYNDPSAEGGRTSIVPANTARSNQILGENVQAPTSCRYGDRKTMRRGDTHDASVHHSDRPYDDVEI